MSRFNVGVNTASGAEVISLSTRAAVAAGWMAPTEDVINAFNEFKRQPMLDQVDKQWPEAQKMHNTYYGIDAPVVSVYRDDSESTHIHVMFSKTGSRMGCRMGAMTFCINAHPVYEHLHDKFHSSRVIVSAIIDDMVPLFAPPQDGETWESRYDLIADYIEEYDVKANPLGLFRHPDKDKLFVPLGQPLPSNGHRFISS
jgi:hypothetical protein